MIQIGFEVLLIFILLIINGLFSMSEIAVVSARRVRLEKSAEEGNLGAKAAVKLSDSPNRFLSTVQIGITLVGVLSGAFGGAALAVHLIPFFEQIAFLKPYAQQVSFGLVVIVITYFSLVIGELVPKRIALNAPEAIAKLVSRPMNFVSKITAPAVWFLSISTNTVLKIFRQTDADEASVTEEELKAMLLQGTTDGILEETEHELMENVIRLDDQNIKALMTPRINISWLNLNSSKNELIEQISNSPFSRLVIADDDLDNVKGYIKAKDILNLVLIDSISNISKVAKKPLFIPETTSALTVLEEFRKSNTQIAVVIDEFGSTQGIITTNDILEAIFGELPFSGTPSESAVQRKDGSWLLDGRLSNSDYCLILEIKDLPKNEVGVYETLAGFIIKRLEKLPAIGDQFVWGNYNFEVVDMDGKRIDRVLVKPI